MWSRGVIVAIGVCLTFGCSSGKDGKHDKDQPKPKPKPGKPVADPTGVDKPGNTTKTAPKKSDPLLARAKKLTQKFIIVDGHVDLPYRLIAGKIEHGKVMEDISKRTEKGDFDYPRAKAGGLNAPFMSIYIPAKHQKEGGAKKLADQLIDMVQGFPKQFPDKFAMAASVADVRAQFAKGLVSLPMGIENGAAIEKDLKNLAHFHKRGVRYITLTHSKDNAICDSSYDKTRTHKGLSAFGKTVVAEMNRLGIMVDISHVSDDTFHQVIELTKVPVIASHSSLRHFIPKFERNMSDDMVKKLAKNGGVIMINFGSGFIAEKAHKQYSKFRAAMAKFGAEMAKLKLSKAELAKRRKAFFVEYKKKSTAKQHFASVSDVADHIERVVKIAGIDHVGLGSDFDGVGDSLPTGLKDASHYPNLIAELLRRKFSERDIGKLCGENVLRVWKAVEDFATPSGTKVKGASNLNSLDKPKGGDKVARAKLRAAVSRVLSAKGGTAIFSKRTLDGRVSGRSLESAIDSIKATKHLDKSQKRAGATRTGTGQPGTSDGVRKASGKVTKKIRGMVRIGAVKGTDDSKNLTPAVVRRTISGRYVHGIRRCYERVLQRDPAAGGNITLRFTVAESGRVRRGKVSGALNADHNACIRKRMYGWRFARPKDQEGDATDAMFRVSVKLVVK